MAMIDIFLIESLYHERRSALGPLIAKWAEVARHSDGDVVVPMPELDKDEKSMAVNLMGPGLDQLAMRIASTMTDISCDALRPGFKASENRADTKRKALLSYWDMNRMDMILRRRARYILGYASSPVSISFMGLNPLDKRDIPHWRVLNPLSVFPATTLDVNDIEPSDCIHAYTQPLKWLQAMYPDQTAVLFKGKASTPDTKFDILEYNDADETVLVALGAVKDNTPQGWNPRTVENYGTQSVVKLARVVNKAEIPLTVYPGRITLSKLQGMFDQLLPIYDNASRLAALEYIAIKQSIFPSQWLVSHPNSPGQAQIITHADGLTGTIGEIRNGQIQETQTQPSIQAAQMQDLLERVGRLAGGLPAELGGESATNIRTARRGEAVLGAAIDMPVQEHQEIFEDSMEAENRRAIAVMRGYFGNKATSFYIAHDGEQTGKPDYTPNDVFENDQNVVKYSVAGTDINAFVVGGLQRVQANTMSGQTFMETDPYIEDVQEELARMSLEGVRRALLQSIEQAAEQGTFASNNIAQLAIALRDGKTPLEDAVTQVHAAMQKAQAAQQAQQPPPGAAAMQPGLGAAMGQQPGAVPNPPPQQGALSQILGNLRSPAPPAGYQAPPQQPGPMQQ